MKKQILVFATTAMIAVGGAFASSSNVLANYYAPGSNTPIDCSGGTMLCSEKAESSFGHTVPDSEGQNESNQVDLRLITAQP